MRILILDIARCLGLFPFNGKGKFQWPRLLYSVLCLTAILSFTIYLRFSAWGNPHFQKIPFQLATILMAFQYFAFIVHLKFMYTHKSNLEKFMIPNSSVKCRSCVLCLSIILPLSLIICSCVCFYVAENDFLMNTIVLLAGLTHFYSYLVTQQFSHFVLTAADMYLSSDGQSTQIRTLFARRAAFDALLVSLMDTHGYQLLIIFTHSFGYLAWLTYSLRHTDGFLYTAFHAASVIVKFMTVCSPCIAAELYLKKLDDHYNRLFNVMKNNPILCEKASLYLYVTTKRKVKLTVCGFFTLGYPLIISIIAGCVHCFVILFQFNI